jgi:hypothetical protein
MTDKYNNKDISTELIEFFPPTYATRAQKMLKTSRWPVFIGLGCAAIVAVGMLVGFGMLSVPHAAFLSSFKAGVSMIIKRAVVGLSSCAGFGLGFGLAQYFGVGQEKPKKGFALIPQDPYRENDEEFSPGVGYYRPLPKPLPSADKQEIVAYSAVGRWLKLRKVGHSKRVVEVSRRLDETYVPLKTPAEFELNDSFMRVTHYNRSENRFLVKLNGSEYKYTQHDLHLLRAQGQSSTSAPCTFMRQPARGREIDANPRSLCYDNRLRMK